MVNVLRFPDATMSANGSHKKNGLSNDQANDWLMTVVYHNIMGYAL